MKPLVIFGKTNSGKTTIAKELEKLGLKRVVTYTTRPIRSNEVDGIDYHFINNDEFNQKKNEGFFIETAEYNAAFGYCQYGSAKNSIVDNTVIVLNPYGVKKLEELNKDFIGVYLDLSDENIKKRAELRGDSTEEIERRLIADKKDFSIPLKKDIIIDCNNLRLNDVDKTAKEILLLAELKSKALD